MIISLPVHTAVGLSRAAGARVVESELRDSSTHPPAELTAAADGALDREETTSSSEDEAPQVEMDGCRENPLAAEGFPASRARASLRRCAGAARSLLASGHHSSQRRFGTR